MKALATFLTNNLPKSLSDEEVEKNAADIEACRDFLCRFECAQDAFTRLSAEEETSDDSVHVGTIHGAKGLEWDAVVILACEDDKFPHYLCETPSEVEEERRLFYVGITRAKQFLGLSWASERRNIEQSPSPFLSEIQSKSELKSGKVSDVSFQKYCHKCRNGVRNTTTFDNNDKQRSRCGGKCLKLN